MLLRQFLELLFDDMLIKINHYELSGPDKYLYEGRALDCPYWIANFYLSNDDEGWIIQDGVLVIIVGDHPLN